MSNKTVPNDNDVLTFLHGIEDDQRRKDALTLLSIFEEITEYPARMWGDSIVGFGSYHYRYESGREGDMLMTGFSPRKAAMSIYIMNGFDSYDSIMKNLGTYRTGKSCLYIKRLEDIDLRDLRQLITESVQYMKHRYVLD